MKQNLEKRFRLVGKAGLGKSAVMRYVLACFSVFLVFLGLVSLARAEIDPESVLVLANSADSSSVELAEYYAEKRGVPAENVIALEMPSDETISGMEFVESIRDPLLERLIDEGWINGLFRSGRDDHTRRNVSIFGHKVGALVLCKGVPLRIAHENLFMTSADLKRLPKEYQTARSSVDSELALLPAGNYRMAGPFGNPVYGKPEPSEIDLLKVIRVSRLDGPSYGDARRLVDLALQAEEEGLMGRAYVDIGGPYKKGDDWLEGVVRLLEGSDFPVDVDREKNVVIQATARFDAPALYFGWYTRSIAGAWKDLSVSVPPGAIAFHIHSFSATSVRNRDLGWSGPFVARGVTATVGNVYEPYLEATHNPVLLLDTLLDGKTLAEAALRSVRFLSWQPIVLGDPLYRPFKVGLEEQLSSVDLSSPFSQYAVIREMNRIIKEEGGLAAAEYGKLMFFRSPGMALGLKTAKLFRENRQAAQALDVLNPFRFSTVVTPDEVAVVVGIAREFDLLGDSASAIRLMAGVADSPGLPTELQISVLEAGREIAMKNGKFVKAEEFRRDIERRKPPEEAAP